jgi:E3 ubiquitin-protein ligase SIAH1
VAIRNLALERIAEEVLFPCKYTEFGCGVRTLYAHKEAHEVECVYRKAFCPIPTGSCPFQGSHQEIVGHLKTFHGLVDESEGILEF